MNTTTKQTLKRIIKEEVRRQVKQPSRKVLKEENYKPELTKAQAQRALAEKAWKQFSEHLDSMEKYMEQLVKDMKQDEQWYDKKSFLEGYWVKAFWAKFRTYRDQVQDTLEDPFRDLYTVDGEHSKLPDHNLL